MMYGMIIHLETDPARWPIFRGTGEVASINFISTLCHTLSSRCENLIENFEQKLRENTKNLNLMNERKFYLNFFQNHQQNSFATLPLTFSSRTNFPLRQTKSIFSTFNSRSLRPHSTHSIAVDDDDEMKFSCLLSFRSEMRTFKNKNVHRT